MASIPYQYISCPPTSKLIFSNHYSLSIQPTPSTLSISPSIRPTTLYIFYHLLSSIQYIYSICSFVSYIKSNSIPTYYVPRSYSIPSLRYFFRKGCLSWAASTYVSPDASSPQLDKSWGVVSKGASKIWSLSLLPLTSKPYCQGLSQKGGLFICLSR